MAEEHQPHRRAYRHLPVAALACSVAIAATALACAPIATRACAAGAVGRAIEEIAGSAESTAPAPQNEPRYMLTGTKSYLEDGRLYTQRSVTYDDNGNVQSTEIWIYADDGSTVHTATAYTRDDDGFPVKMDALSEMVPPGAAEADFSQAQTFDLVNEFDDGLLVRSTTVPIEGRSTETVYTYDDQGDVVEVTTVAEDQSTRQTQTTKYSRGYTVESHIVVEDVRPQSDAVEPMLDVKTQYLWGIGDTGAVEYVRVVQGETDETHGVECDEQGNVTAILFDDGTVNIAYEYELVENPSDIAEAMPIGLL